LLFFSKLVRPEQGQGSIQGVETWIFSEFDPERRQERERKDGAGKNKEDFCGGPV
jgi:hypothetical protein